MQSFISLLLSLCILLLPYRGNLAQASTAREVSPETMKTIIDCASLRGENIEVREVPREDVHHRSTSTTYWGNFNFGGSSSLDGEAALVLFAIIGVIVVIAVIPYAVSYLIDLARGEDVCYFHEFSLNGLYLQDQKTLASGETLRSRRNLSSITYTAHVDRGGSSGLGLSFELGYHSFQDSDILEQGGYGMLGPRLYFAKSNSSNSYGFIEVLGGQSFNEDVGTIGKAQIGFRTHPWASRSFGFGFSLGSLYVDMEAAEGFINPAEKFDMFLSFSLSSFVD